MCRVPRYADAWFHISLQEEGRLLCSVLQSEPAMCTYDLHYKSYQELTTLSVFSKVTRKRTISASALKVLAVTG